MTIRGIRRRSGIDASSYESNDMIASMAKGIAEVQSGALDQTEIVNMLQQISQQLNQLQGQAQFVNPLQQNMKESASGPTQKESLSKKDDSSQQRSSLAELQRLVSQLAQNQEQQSEQNVGGNKAHGQTHMRNFQQQVTQKAAAQALTEAQYELSIELENSLKKLKQVISESEKLADKITNLISEEATKYS